MGRGRTRPHAYWAPRRDLECVAGRDAQRRNAHAAERPTRGTRRRAAAGDRRAPAAWHSSCSSVSRRRASSRRPRRARRARRAGRPPPSPAARRNTQRPAVVGAACSRARGHARAQPPAEDRIVELVERRGERRLARAREPAQRAVRALPPGPPGRAERAAARRRRARRCSRRCCCCRC